MPVCDRWGSGGHVYEQVDRLVGHKCWNCGLSAVAEAHWRPSSNSPLPWLVRCQSCRITWRATSLPSDHPTTYGVGYLWPALNEKRGPLLDGDEAYLAKIDRCEKATAETDAKALVAAVKRLRKGASQHDWSPVSAFTQRCTWCGVSRRLAVRPGMEQPSLAWSYALDNGWTVPGAPEPPGKLECILRVLRVAAKEKEK
jgi:hypothetical protein